MANERLARECSILLLAILEQLEGIDKEMATNRLLGGMMAVHEILSSILKSQEYTKAWKAEQKAREN